MALAFSLFFTTLFLAGFLWLTAVEKRRGARYFESMRRTLDQRVDAVTLYLSSEHQGPSLQKTFRTVFEHLVHDLVHGVLIVVRFVERMLTRLTREIRRRRAHRTQTGKEEDSVPVE